MIKTKKYYRRGAFVVWLNKSTIEFYFPHFVIGVMDIGFMAKTLFLLKINSEQNPPYYPCRWSLAIMLLGFGIGIAREHFDNPVVRDSYDEADI